MTKPKRLKSDHVIFNGLTRKMICEHCGDQEILPLPMLMTEAARKMNAFNKQHRGCQKP